MDTMIGACQKIFTSSMSEEKFEEYIEGDRVLGYPNENGIYKINALPEKTTALFFMYNPSRGWVWHPGVRESNPYPEKWYPISQVNIPLKNEDGIVRLTSPLSANMQYIQKLQKLQQKDTYKSAA